MIYVTHDIALDPAELRWQQIRSSGPGGQNVNKVATAVQLFFDARQSASLPEGVRRRLLERGGANLTGDGVVVIKADTERTQPANREEALRRLKKMIREVARPPKPRKKTRPTRAAKERRLGEKKHRSDIKSGRGRIAD